MDFSTTMVSVILKARTRAVTMSLMENAVPRKIIAVVIPA